MLDPANIRAINGLFDESLVHILSDLKDFTKVSLERIGDFLHGEIIEDWRGG